MRYGKRKRIKIDLQLKKPEQFRDIFHEWNWKLANQGLDTIVPQKPTIIEQRTQQKSKKTGVPRWAKHSGGRN